MPTISRTERQDTIWERMNEIRLTTGPGLRTPDLEGYDGADGELDTEYDELVTEYAAIHEANGTAG